MGETWYLDGKTAVFRPSLRASPRSSRGCIHRRESCCPEKPRIVELKKIEPHSRIFLTFCFPFSSIERWLSVGRASADGGTLSCLPALSTKAEKGGLTWVDGKPGPGEQDAEDGLLAGSGIKRSHDRTEVFVGPGPHDRILGALRLSTPGSTQIRCWRDSATSFRVTPGAGPPQASSKILSPPYALASRLWPCRPDRLLDRGPGAETVRFVL